MFKQKCLQHSLRSRNILKKPPTKLKRRSILANKLTNFFHKGSYRYFCTVLMTTGTTKPQLWGFSRTQVMQWAIFTRIAFLQHS